MFRVFVASLVLVACSRAPMPAPAAPLPSHVETSTERNFINRLPPSRETGPGARISGRVVLDGHPVTFFGVTATTDATFTPGLGSFFRPIAFQTSDGRFTITPPNVRERDLIIAGPGFERISVRALPRDQTDIGDVNVMTGHRIDGVVRDESGHQVAGAKVTFSPSTSAATATARDDIDELTALLLGVITVTSDKHGRYVIEGAAGDPPWPAKYVDGPPQLIARSTDLASMPVSIPDDDTTADLTLHKSGVLELVAPGRAHDEIVLVTIRAATAPDVGLRVALYDHHSHVRTQVAAGDYDVVVSLHGRGNTKQRVSVTASGTTKVVAE